MDFRIFDNKQNGALTQREKQVLNLIAHGFTNKQIGIQLEMSEQTAKNHVTHILEKLITKDRANSVYVGMKQGLIK